MVGRHLRTTTKRLWGAGLLAGGLGAGIILTVLLGSSASAAPESPGELTAAECPSGYVSTGDVTYRADAVSTDQPAALVDRYVAHRGGVSALRSAVRVQAVASDSLYTADVLTADSLAAARVIVERSESLGWRISSIQECGA